MTGDCKVEQVLRGCPPELRDVAEALRRLVKGAAPRASERGYTGWGNLVYDNNGMFCYIAPLKDSVNLGFQRGIDLSDPEGLLRGTGKSMRHVKVRKREDIRADALSRLVTEAYRVNEGRGPTRAK